MDILDIAEIKTHAAFVVSKEMKDNGVTTRKTVDLAFRNWENSIGALIDRDMAAMG
jgi:hypothetical protein